ncbi:hypothetical protein ACOMHN_033482 [Nucella lapillus]
MDYCPEIAILHGAFACIEAESKNGKYDLHHHTKGDKSSRPYRLIRDVIQEIVAGPELPHSPSDRKKWSRHLHHVLFCKAFVFSQQFASREMEEEEDGFGKVIKSFKAWCLPLPDFHPHFFFDLSEEFDWAEFLGEAMEASDLTTTLTFARHSLTFCTPDPALLYDLSLMSATLDALLSCIVSEIIHMPEMESQNTELQNKGAKPSDRTQTLFSRVVLMSQKKYQDLSKKCQEAAFQSEQVNTTSPKQNSGSELVEESDMDHETKVEVLDAANQLVLDHILQQLDQKVQDNLTQIVELALEMLKLMHKRMSTKLFNRSSCRRGAMASVLPVLGRILSSVIVFCVLSVFDQPSNFMKDCFTGWLLKEEDGDHDSSLEANSTCPPLNSSDSNPSEHPHKEPISLVAEAFSLLIRTSRTVCLKCLSSFFAVQTAKGPGSLQKLSVEKSVKFGRVVKLNHPVSHLPKPLKLVRVVQKFSELLAGGYFRVKEDEELMACMSPLVTELGKREQAAEEKWRNPCLADVMDKVQKKRSRWEWCLQYGLAKRDLKDWWFAGFLGFVHKHPSLLSTESDFRNVATVLQGISADCPKSVKERDTCAELVSRTFAQLPPETREQILLETYRDTTQPGLQIVSDFEKTLTIAFNKLSANTVHKNLCGILPLALHDLLTFTDYAVSMAISSKGQIPVVVKVFQLIPGVMRSVHPLHHPGRSLLGHCLHSVIHGRSLDTREQTNCLSLLSYLVKPTATDPSQNPPLLPPAEFLSSSVLPFIFTSLAGKDSQPTSLLALRLLIGCLEATLSVGFSDWLEELQLAVVVRLCGEMLQDCAESMWGDADDANCMVVQVTVLCVVDLLLKHFAEGGIKIEGQSLHWVLEGCARFHWVVCAYLAPCLGPIGAQMIAGYVNEATQKASENPAGLLQLSATSDAASQEIIDAMRDCDDDDDDDDLHIPQTSLVISLAQILPSILVREVHRVVSVLTVWVSSGRVRMELHHRALLDSSVLDLSEYGTKMVVCQLLTEAVAVMVAGEDNSNAPLLQHVGQLLVTALQTLLTQSGTVKNDDDEDEESTMSRVLKTAAFHQVCAVVSDSPAPLTDPLFVLLLDLLSAVSPQDPESGDASPSSKDAVRDVLMHGIGLIRDKRFRDTLTKKMNYQNENAL